MNDTTKAAFAFVYICANDGIYAIAGIEAARLKADAGQNCIIS